MKGPLKPLEDRIRDAVASGEFAKANALWVELGDRLHHESAGRTLSAARVRQTRELLKWCLIMAIADRARCQQRLNQIAVSVRYLTPRLIPAKRLLARL